MSWKHIVIFDGKIEYQSKPTNGLRVRRDLLILLDTAILLLEFLQDCNLAARHCNMNPLTLFMAFSMTIT